jgi:2-oxoglutarate ferredoxin oxidoreductase subunit alpha
VLAGYDKVVLPEMNLGQVATLIRSRYLVDIFSVTEVRGMPFRAATSPDVARVLTHE